MTVPLGVDVATRLKQASIVFLFLFALLLPPPVPVPPPLAVTVPLLLLLLLLPPPPSPPLAVTVPLGVDVAPRLKQASIVFTFFFRMIEGGPSPLVLLLHSSPSCVA
jgi:hypothetical protein